MFTLTAHTSQNSHTSRVQQLRVAIGYQAGQHSSRMGTALEWEAARFLLSVSVSESCPSNPSPSTFPLGSTGRLCHSVGTNHTSAGIITNLFMGNIHVPFSWTGARALFLLSPEHPIQWLHSTCSKNMPRLTTYLSTLQLSNAGEMLFLCRYKTVRQERKGFLHGHTPPPDRQHYPQFITFCVLICSWTSS